MKHKTKHLGEGMMGLGWLRAAGAGV